MFIISVRRRNYVRDTTNVGCWLGFRSPIGGNSGRII